MPRVQIVYDLDPKSSSVGASISTPADTKAALATLDPNVPKTITARGLAKLETNAKLGISKTCSSCSQFETMRTELLNHGELWCDPDFPAESKSLYYSKKINCEWKRPKEIAPNAKFVCDGFNRFDVKQGELGNCWFLAAVADLTLHNELFEKVVPVNQDFGDNYCGAFYFRFWQFGNWKEIIIDDRIPTRNNKPLYMHSADCNEFWSALLEKAYAKMYGSYETLSGGLQCEAMEDFTGGLAETVLLDTPEGKSEHTLHMMLKSSKQSSLMGCCIDSDNIEGQLPNGLITGHAYSVTGVRHIDYNGNKIGLIRVRNPWGEREWNGAWSDKAPEWKSITETQKKELDLLTQDDGEFWMSFQDFTKNFTKLEICHLGPESLCTDKIAGTNKRRWEECKEVGSWQKNISAGGCRNFLETFPTNPQFRVKVTDADETDDDAKGTLMIGLMQKDMRIKNLPYHTIGYSVYQLKDPKPEPMTKMFFKTNTSVARSEFINQREVFGRHKLNPGNYLIIVSTYEPNMEANFVLRILSERPAKSNEVDCHNEYTNHAASLAGKSALTITRSVEQTDEQRKEQILKGHFNAFAGPLETINASQLKNLLNATIKKELSFFAGFSTEVCRSLVSLYDCDQTGKIEYNEFQELWKDLRVWKNVFNEHDFDKTGDFNAFELRQALEHCGFKISNTLHICLANRYTDPDSGKISFEDFVLCVVRLRTGFENLKHAGKDAGGRAIFGDEEFLRLSVYV